MLTRPVCAPICGPIQVVGAGLKPALGLPGRAVCDVAQGGAYQTAVSRIFIYTRFQIEPHVLLGTEVLGDIPSGE